jgi:hypothetical protein
MALTEHEKGLITNTMKGIAPVIRELEQRMYKLEQRIAELEGSSLRYMGAHQPSIAYRKGDVVSYEGCAWCATRDVSVERPGRSDGFQMMIKSAEASSSPRSDATAAHARNGHAGGPANPRARSP